MDWQPGDIAKCVYDEWFTHPKPLECGRSYTVVAYKTELFHTPNLGFFSAPAITLLEVKHPQEIIPGQVGFGAYRFVKQPPLIKEDEAICEEELTR